YAVGHQVTPQDGKTIRTNMPKQRLPSVTPAQKAFNKNKTAAEDQTTRYVIPLYAIENKERYALGSAVLLQIGDKEFLLSAAHVFDVNKNPKSLTDIAIPGANTFIPVYGSVSKSPLPRAGKRVDDKIDLAIVRLDEHRAAQLGHHTFLDIRHVDPCDKP